MFTSIRTVWYVQIFLGLKLLFKPKYSKIYIFHANNDFGSIKKIQIIPTLESLVATNGAPINSMLIMLIRRVVLQLKKPPCYQTQASDAERDDYRA